jgi:carnitine 3-dehydrogenase / betainyl-CoA thioesterase
MADRPATAALLGGGVIGGGWAARLLLNGVDVRVFDPDPQAPRRLDELLGNARRAYARLTMLPPPAEGRLVFCGSLEEAVGGVEFIQESTPERLELKRGLLAAVGAAADPAALICSSTSGLRPTELQAQMPGPERLVVGHPFNPVYLVPLVEVCAGERTAPASVRRAVAIYRSLGMHPVVVRTEIDGFLADRLLEALWREALWLVHDDVATVAELDDVIRYGPGLRWAFMGTFLTYRIAGGELGMRHFIEQFGPALQAPWTKLVDVPELDAEFVAKLLAQSDAQAGGRSIAELERARDDCLVALLQGLRGEGAGAGESLAAWERELMSANGKVDLEALDRLPAPLALVRRTIPPDWLDYNEHVTESRYLQLASDAIDAVLRVVGIDAAALVAGSSYYTVESHISHLGQLRAGDRVEVLTQVLGFDDKRLHVFHRIVRAGEAEPVATAEQMLLHVDAGAGRAAPAPERVRARVAALAAAHATLPRPERAGRAIALP